MKVLLTGNLGYIGTVLTKQLRKKSYNVIGYDIDYYRGCELENFHRPRVQINKDIRDIELADLDGIDAVIHLAALSNDPLGELAPNLTENVNYNGSIKLAKLAKEAGVNRFVYASSQSMYGISDSDDELDEYNSTKNPITAYARTKWEVEEALKKMSDSHFNIVCFRPSTVFGASPRLRCDIVFNNFVACAYTTGKIEIMSDGSPWRPVVHVKDVSNAFIAGLEAPVEIIANQSYNVGIPDGNFTVKELAKAAQSVVPGSELRFMGEHVDSRTYKISFSRILNDLKDYYKPQWTLHRGGDELVELFKKVNFDESDFRGNKFIRLNQINDLISKNVLNKDLRFN